jgi:hypothetical protein
MINRSVIYLNVFTGGAGIIYNHSSSIMLFLSKQRLLFPQETRNSICLWLSHTTMLQNKVNSALPNQFYIKYVLVKLIISFQTDII